MKRIFAAALLVFLSGSALSQAPHSFMPENGFVPTPEVAIRIAVAVWEPIYGASNIERQKPYTATLAKGVWLVQGSLPRDWVGGVAVAEISQTDGRVLRVSHGK